MIAYEDSWIDPGHTLNIILEYAPGGTLQSYLDRARVSGAPIPTPRIRRKEETRCRLHNRSEGPWLRQGEGSAVGGLRTLVVESENTV